MLQNKSSLSLTALVAGLGIIFATAACTPTIKVEAPDKPIEINMNIKIEQEVRVRVEKDLESAFAEDPELFGTTVTPKAQ
jgi:hypothetical protein